MDNTEINQVCSLIFYDVKNPASFSGPQKLYNAVKLITPAITLSNVKHWLSKQLAYTLHKPALRKHKRNPIIVHGIDDQWEADLIDLQEFRRKNNYVSYLLTVIDVFSKYAWAIPLKNKSQTSVSNAFEKILAEGRIPSRLRTDKGKEFLNNNFKHLIIKYNIVHFTSNDPTIKCGVIERFNRTLKGKMFRYFTANNTRKYVDILDDLLLSYNSTYHSKIKAKPIDVNENNENLIFKNLYGVENMTELLKKTSENKKENLKIGDKVRKQIDLKSFDKSYFPLWSDVVYRIKAKKRGTKVSQYKVNEPHSNTDLKQKPYKSQLQKITPDKYRVEKIIKRRINNRIVEYYVKWIGYPNSANSWITIDNL